MRFHTITACKAPCNRGSGIGFPLANGRGLFDSGELGYGPTISTARSCSAAATASVADHGGRRRARRQGEVRKDGARA